MRAYIEFIRPSFRNMVLLDVLFLLLVVVKLFFIEDLSWVLAASGYIMYWFVATIGYLWSKYKGYLD